MTRSLKFARGAAWLTAAAVGFFSLVGLVAVSRADRPAATPQIFAGHKITGTVVDTSGKPAAETSVRLLQAQSMKRGPIPKDPNDNPTGGSVIGTPEAEKLQKSGGARGEKVIKQATTDATGHFTFTDVANGKYAIMAGIGKETAREEIEIKNGDPGPITLKLTAN